jgi:PKD repeat protein
LFASCSDCNITDTAGLGFTQRAAVPQLQGGWSEFYSVAAARLDKDNITVTSSAGQSFIHSFAVHGYARGIFDVASANALNCSYYDSNHIPCPGSLTTTQMDFVFTGAFNPSAPCASVPGWNRLSEVSYLMTSDYQIRPQPGSVSISYTCIHYTSMGAPVYGALGLIMDAIELHPPTYTLTWQGYDWDGGHEETIYLNGQAVASLPPTSVSSNGGAWASFSLNITSFVVQGTNRLTFAHAGWDCGTSDNVRNLLITSGSNVVYSNSTSLPLNCTQSLTYTFTIGTATPPPTPPPLTLTESFDTANSAVGQTCTFGGLASGGVPPYSFSWDFGDGTSGFGSSVTHIYTAPGKYAVTLTVKDSAWPSPNTLSVTGFQIVSAQPPQSTGKYTLSWQGYDWDGAGEETITLNGHVITTLPGIDTPSNGGAWALFSLNVTSYVVKGVNTLTFTHANWDCGTSDDVRNLQLTSGTTVIYSNPNESPLSCTQTLTYTFTV